MIAKEGEIIQWIRILAALDKDWSSDPSTLLSSSQPSVTPVSRNHTFSSVLWGHLHPCACPSVCTCAPLMPSLVSSKVPFLQLFNQKKFLPIHINWHGVKSFFFICLFYYFCFLKSNKLGTRSQSAGWFQIRKQIGTSYGLFWELQSLSLMRIRLLIPDWVHSGKLTWFCVKKKKEKKNSQ